MYTRYNILHCSRRVFQLFIFFIKRFSFITWFAMDVCNALNVFLLACHTSLVAYKVSYWFIRKEIRITDSHTFHGSYAIDAVGSHSRVISGRYISSDPCYTPRCPPLPMWVYRANCKVNEHGHSEVNANVKSWAMYDDLWYELPHSQSMSHVG
jgi:hypothetical protein